MVGKTVKFLVSKEKIEFHIQEKLVIANSPHLADLLKKVKLTLDSLDPALFQMCNAWMCKMDGTFVYKPTLHMRARDPGFPYTPLVRLFILAVKLRVAAFANAVLLKIVEVYQHFDQVADNTTISLIYKEKLEDQPIHTLFVDMAAHFTNKSEFVSYENLHFANAVIQRHILIRDDECKLPLPQDYYIRQIDDPEDCVFVRAEPATNPLSTPGPSIKQEHSATLVANPSTPPEDNSLFV
jgi:hypothetical protein